MSWASQRQATYFFGLVFILLLIIGIPTFFALYDPPACTDGIRNGTEEGTDCGGECPIVCSFQAAAPLVHWSRLFEIVPGVYTADALIENPNSNFEAQNVSYLFKLRDLGSLLVAEKEGTIELPARKQIPIFITGLQTGERVPVRVEFSWQGEPVWTESTELEDPLIVTDREVQNADVSPRVTATMMNSGTMTISDLPVIVILFDSEGNALHASRTIIESLPPSKETPVIFTWPKPFERPVSKIEIISLLHEATLSR